MAGGVLPADLSAAGASVAHEGGAHYAHLFGQAYRTDVDLYLFTLYGDTDTIYLGRNDGMETAKLPDLPKSVAAANVGRSFGVVTVLDVVPAGSTLILTAETHEVTAQSKIREKGGYPLGFICTLITTRGSTDGVRCEFIQTAAKAPPNTPNQAIAPSIATNLSH